MAFAAAWVGAGGGAKTGRYVSGAGSTGWVGSDIRGALLREMRVDCTQSMPAA